MCWWVFGLVDIGSVGDYLRACNPTENGSSLAPASQADLRRRYLGVAASAVVVAIGCG